MIRVVATGKPPLQKDSAEAFTLPRLLYQYTFSFIQSRSRWSCATSHAPSIGIGFMDERDLLTGDAAGYELFPDVVINCERRFFGCILTNGSFQRVKFRTVEVPACGLCRSGCRHCRFWCGEVAEDELGELICLSVLPDGIDIIHAQINLTACLIRQVGIDNALVKPQLAPIRGDLEHIICACVHDPRVDSCNTLVHSGFCKTAGMYAHI